MGTVLDILFGGIFVAVLIYGLLRGFAKQFTSFTTVFGTFICAIVLSGLLLKPAMDDTKTYTIVRIVGTWFHGMQGADTIVTSSEHLATVLSSGPFRIFLNSVDSIWETMSAYYLYTVGEYVAYLVVQVVVFLILLLIFYAFMSNVFKAVGFFLYSLSQTFSAIDKILGAIWNVLFTYVLLVCFALTGIEVALGLYLPNVSDAFLSLISQSTLISLGHNTNLVGAILASLFGYSLPPLIVV